MVKNRLSILVSLLVIVALVACDTTSPTGSATPTSSSNAGAAGRINVITTTTQIRSLAEAVAGDLADVHSILTPGADPHEFEPKPSDVTAITTATLVLKNGVGLDDWMDKLITNAGGQRPLVTVSMGVLVRKGDEQEPAGDPHIWFDVTNAMRMTRNIRDALVQADAPHADAYKANADAYLKKLADLDKYIMDQVA